MELEPNLLHWNVNQLEHELELEHTKRTVEAFVSYFQKGLLRKKELLHYENKLTKLV